MSVLAPFTGSDQLSGNGRTALTSASPPPRKGQAPPNKGIRAPWVGSWGPMTDRRSKLSRRAQRIERELVEHYAPVTSFERRKVRSAARYRALSEMTLETIGTDPKSTRRAASALQAAADRELSGLSPRKTAPPTTGHELLAQMESGT